MRVSGWPRSPRVLSVAVPWDSANESAMARPAVSRLTDIGVGDALERGMQRTERALAKLDEGTYGVCDACGSPIARGRLKAMPDGVLCLQCAASEARVSPRRR